MFEAVRGIGNRSSQGFGGSGWLAILLTTAGFAGVAGLAPAVPFGAGIAPASAALAGFLGSSVIVALRTVRARRQPSRRDAAATSSAGAVRQPDPDTPASAPDDHVTRTDVADLAEAIGHARISRIVLPLGARGGAFEAIALARQLSSKRVSTIFVDFGAEGVAQEMGLIDPPRDVMAIAASPTTFAHSIHRDRTSGAHVIAATIATADGGEDAVADAAATILDALGEAYSRTVVAIPAACLQRFEALIDADTAVVVPVSSVGDAATRRLLDDLRRRGVTDVVFVALEAEARRFAVA